MESSPSKATPRTLIMGMLASKGISESALKTTRRSSRVSQTPTHQAQPKASSGSGRKTLSETDGTPRSLIQGFLNVHQTAAPSTRKRARRTPSPAAPMPPPSSRRQSTRKSAIMNQMRLNEPQSKVTPRSAITNFLAQAQEETPARPVDQTLNEMPSTSEEMTKIVNAGLQKLSNILKPLTPVKSPQHSQRSTTRVKRKEMSLQSFASGVQQIRDSQGDNSTYDDLGVSGLESIMEDETEDAGRTDMGAAIQSRDIIADIDKTAVDEVAAGDDDMDVGVESGDADATSMSEQDVLVNEDPDNADDDNEVENDEIEDVDDNVDVNNDVDDQDDVDDVDADVDQNNAYDSDDDNEADLQGQDSDDAIDPNDMDDNDDGAIANERHPVDDVGVDGNRAHTGSRAFVKDSAGESSALEKSNRRSFVQQTLDIFANLKTPVIQAKPRKVSPSLITPLLVKQSRKPTPPKLKAKKQTKPPVKQKQLVSKEERLGRLPPALTKGIFQHFSRSRVSRAAMAEVEKMTDHFWKNVSGDLAAYSNHRHGGVTIDESDLELLMKRQRFITTNESMYTLVEKHLPLEYRQEIIPVAKSGNVVVPKH